MHVVHLHHNRYTLEYVVDIQLYRRDGGHKRAIAHYLEGIPLPVDFSDSSHAVPLSERVTLGMMQLRILDNDSVQRTFADQYLVLLKKGLT